MSILTDSSKSTTRNSDQSTKKKSSPKSRNLIFGRRSSPEKILATIVELSKTHKISEIVEISGKSESTIKRYLKKGKKLGVVNTTEKGRTTQDEATKTHNYIKSITSDEFSEKYPKVGKWVDRRTAEAKGDKAKLRSVKDQLAKVKVVCDTVKINPIMMLSQNEDGVSYGGLENVMLAFSICMVEGSVSYLRKGQKQPDPENISAGFRSYLIACRSFAVYGGVALPKMPPDHILSGKKVGYGQYAHIKMSQQQINEVIKLLAESYGIDSIQVAMICFYYVTGTRNNSIYPVKTATATILSNGWHSCRVYESKQHYTWKKYIPNDIYPHFEILQKWILKRQKDHKEYLFSENGSADNTIHDELAESLREIYKKIGLLDEYFFSHPIHTWRHVSAHWWKSKVKSVEKVCKIVGWKDIQTFIDCYGETSDEEIFEDVELPQ